MVRLFKRDAAATAKSRKTDEEKRRSSLRTRILLVAWAPSMVLLLVGGTVASLMIVEGRRDRTLAEIFYTPQEAEPYLSAVQIEMRFNAQFMVNAGSASKTRLTEQRARTDATLQGFQTITSQVRAEYTTDNYRTAAAELQQQFRELSVMREAIDQGTVSLSEATHFYGDLQRGIGTAVQNLSESAPAGEPAVTSVRTKDFWAASNHFAEANALAHQAFSRDGLNEQEYLDLARTLGYYRDELDDLAPYLAPTARAGYADLVASSAWKQQEVVEQAALAAGPGRAAELPIDRDTWAANADQISVQLASIGVDQVAGAGAAAVEIADRKVAQALIGTFALLLLAITVIGSTTWVANRLVRRLRTLQLATLDMAQIRLPHIIGRLRAGEKVDVDEDVPEIHLGNDEIGEVAEAFNEAQRVAVSAAVQEAETRSGLRLVFLNIARRSQIIVHQQLSVLEQAERYEEDPEQLKLLFELDHLSTRARRNAENLVILGDGTPGRQWRNSVALSQVVRGAISEAQDYTRVTVTELPRLSIVGSAVADMVHLLAEIVDNATTFSPPMSRVEVRGNLVGRGLVIEVEDQGLGIPPYQLAQLNEMMTKPPEFQVMALREEPRLGMFVVGQLARKNGVRVTLTASPAYGGTRVVILLPDALLDTADQQPHPGEDVVLAAHPTRSLHERMAFHGELAPEHGNGRSRLTVVAAPEAPPGRPDLTAAPRPAVPEPEDDRRRYTAGAASLPRRPGSPTPTTPWAASPASSGPWTSRSTENLAGQGISTGSTTAPTPVVSVTRPVPDAPTQPNRDQSQDRPALPRRVRQANLSDRLKNQAPEPWTQERSAPDNPDRARSTMTAFQSGTRRARAHSTDDT